MCENWEKALEQKHKKWVLLKYFLNYLVLKGYGNILKMKLLSYQKAFLQFSEIIREVEE